MWKDENKKGDTKINTKQHELQQRGRETGEIFGDGIHKFQPV